MGGSGRIWEELGGNGRKWEELGGTERNWEELGGARRKWEELGGIGRNWKELRETELERENYRANLVRASWATSSSTFVKDKIINILISKHQNLLNVA